MKRLAAIAAVLGALLAAVSLASGSEQRSKAAPQATTAAAAKIVGEVTGLGGTERLRVTPARGGKAVAVHEGAKLRLGDVLDPGNGVKATIKLKIPTGVPTDTELIFIRPTDGKRHDVTLRRTGPRATTVTIDG